MGERRATVGSGEASVLETLNSAERGAVLDELMRLRPQLRTAAERIAREQLADTEREAVAEGVEWELRSLASDELHGRTGRQRWGYVRPTEAAWRRLEEAVGSYEREIKRLIALGMIAPAIETAVGVIIGLSRSEGCTEGDRLLSWAPDFPIEHARYVVHEITGAGLRIPSEALAGLTLDWAAALGVHQSPCP